MTQQAENTDHKLDRWFRRYVAPQVGKTAAIVYSFGIPMLERQQGGTYRPVTLSHDKLGSIVFTDRHAVSLALEKLKEAKVVDYERGLQGPGRSPGSTLRRLTWPEIRSVRYGEGFADKLPTNAPMEAMKLTALMNARSPLFHGQRPHFQTYRTGRIGSCNPCIHNAPAKERWKTLMEGVEPGRWLIEIDVKRAEPDIIKQLLKRDGLLPPNLPEDLYQFAANQLRIKRDDAKAKVNAMSYCRDSQRMARGMGFTGGPILDFALALDLLKTSLWDNSKGSGARRFARTLGGSVIPSIKGDAMHKGKLLNWTVQGTVADFINRAALRIVDSEERDGCRLVLPVYDALYLNAQTEPEAERGAAILDNEIARLGLRLDLNISKEQKLQRERERERERERADSLRTPRL